MSDSSMEFLRIQNSIFSYNLELIDSNNLNKRNNSFIEIAFLFIEMFLSLDMTSG